MLARLTLTNESAATVLIEPFNALTGAAIDADVFHIVTGRDEVVRYTGMMVKRGKPAASECSPRAGHAAQRRR